MKKVDKFVCIIVGGMLSFASHAYDCSKISDWKKTDIYNKGDEVQIDNVAYRAKWWTRGKNPNNHHTIPAANKNKVWPVWNKLGNCGEIPPPPPPPTGDEVDCSNISEWGKNKPYDKAEQAQLEGMAYSAKWWTTKNPKINNEQADFPVWTILGNCAGYVPHLDSTIGATDIRPTRNDTKSIISIYKDDGVLKSTQLWCDYMTKYGVEGKITEGLVVQWVTDRNQWDAWRKLYKTGCLDIANHSYNHIKMVGGSIDQWNKKPENINRPSSLDKEINEAKVALERELPDAGKLAAYVVPFGDIEVEPIKRTVMQHHQSMKGGNKHPGQNTLNPPSERWFKLKQREQKSSTTLADMKGWVDEAIRTNGFMAISTHSCGDQEWAALDCSVWDNFFAYLGSRKGKYWFEGAGLVTKYLKQKQTATYQSTVVSSVEINVTLTDTLDDAVFDYPLLLRTVVPQDWRQVQLDQDGVSAKEKVVFKEMKVVHGIKYIYYEAIPDRGRIVIYKVK